jgi:GTP-binding protein EngB required for normal cell division
MTMTGAFTPSTSSALDEIRAIALEIRASEIADDAAALAARVAEGLFYVTCIGQFKRGKSTLINALIGAPLLPSGVVPVTAAITIVRYGDTVRAGVLFEDGRQAQVDPSTLRDYITEERNPGNAKQVRAVEVAAPSNLLASGMCLVDTPGLGSIFEQNTGTTRAFLPHIDAALIVLGADPPLSGEEAAVAEEIARDVPHIVFVLNKADRLDEADVAEATTFTRRALATRLGIEIRLFVVSALERLEGVATREWPALEAALAALARDAGADLVSAAQERGQRRLATSLLRDIATQRDALTRPIAETESRVAALRKTIDDARRALSDLGYLFTAEQHRLTREFGAERSRFLDATLSNAPAKLDEHIASADRLDREDIVRAAERIAHDAVGGWIDRIEPRAEQLYAAATERFIALAGEFLDRVDMNESADLEIEQHFRKRRGFYFTSLWALTGRPPGAGLIDLAFTANQKRERARRDAHAYLRRLLESNSARVANDLSERVLESRRMLEGEIRSILDRTVVSAERALERARASRDAGAEAVARGVAELDAVRQRLAKFASAG